MSEPETNPFAPPKSEIVDESSSATNNGPKLYEEPSLLIRAASLSVDGAILLCLAGLSWAVIEQVDNSLSFGVHSRVAWGIAILLFFFVNLPWLRKSQSIGKAAFGLWVVREDDHETCNRARLIARWLLFLPLPLVSISLGAVLLLLDAFLGLRDPPRCGHDELAGTSVLR